VGIIHQISPKPFYSWAKAVQNTASAGASNLEQLTVLLSTRCRSLGSQAGSASVLICPVGLAAEMNVAALSSSCKLQRVSQAEFSILENTVPWLQHKGISATGGCLALTSPSLV